jgi:hypothetical protein
VAILTALRPRNWLNASKAGLKNFQKPLTGQGNVSNFHGPQKWGDGVSDSEKERVKIAVDGVGKVTKLNVTKLIVL